MLIDFIKSYENWEEILSMAPYNIKIKHEPPYILLKYGYDTDFNLPLVRECRGCIIHEDTLEYVCRPFDKFGNYGESYCPEIDWSNVWVQEKIDGSIIKIWKDDEQWYISTNGQIDAFNAATGNVLYPTYGDLVNAAMDVTTLYEYLDRDPDLTYIFELVSPYTQVVVPHKDIKLYLIGIRETKSGKEYNPRETSLKYVFNLPQQFNLCTLQDIQDAAAALPWDEEGYVVCDKHFNRLKIKSPAYVRAHYCRNNGVITQERLIDIIETNEIDEFLIYAPEYKNTLVALQERMALMEQQLLLNIEAIDWKLERKELAQVVLHCPQWMHKYLFHYADNRPIKINYKKELI